MTEGNCPVEKDILKLSHSGWEMPFFSNFKIFTRKLYRPNSLCESREYIIIDISYLSVGFKKKVFVSA